MCLAEGRRRHRRRAPIAWRECSARSADTTGGRAAEHAALEVEHHEAIRRIRLASYADLSTPTTRRPAGSNRSAARIAHTQRALERPEETRERQALSTSYLTSQLAVSRQSCPGRQAS